MHLSLNEITGGLARVFSKLRMKTAKRTDERIRTMNEIVSGMRVIKMYTWEKPFAKLIELCRKYIMREYFKTKFSSTMYFNCS